jgi:hypothetical protein
MSCLVTNTSLLRGHWVQVLLCGVSGGAGGHRHSGRSQASRALELLHVFTAALSRCPAETKGLECAPAGLFHQ